MSSAHVPFWAKGLLRLHPEWFRRQWGSEVEATLVRSLELERGGLTMARAALDLARSAVTSRRRGAPGAGRRLGGGAPLRQSVRSLLRQPVFAAAAVATLTIGIGANTAVFGLVYSLLFRPFAYPESDRLVVLWSNNPSRGWTDTDVTLADAHDWATRTDVFSGVAVIARSTVNLTGTERPERLEARAATANVLDVLGVAPRLGRGFQPADAIPGAPGVVILSDGLWQRRFGGEAGVVNSVIQLNGEPYTVIGVMPPEFVLPDARPDVLLALRVDPATASRENHSHIAIGRLAAGVTLARASRAVSDVAEALAVEYPQTNEGWGAYAVSLRQEVLQPEGIAAARVLMVAVLFVLLMACVNVANLMLARGRARRREMALRTALGAGRLRLIQQMLTESAILAATGALFGLLLAVWAMRLIVATLPSNMPPVFEFAMDGPVLLFAVAITVIATLAFGLLPALRGSRASASELREEGRSGSGRSGRRFGSALVVVQMALAVVLLIGGGTLMRSVAHMRTQDLGWDPTGLMTFRTTLPAARYADAAAVNAFHDALLERLRGLPGVTSAGAIHSLPLRGSNSVNTFSRPGGSEADAWPARLSWVSAGYLETMGIEVVSGRAIEATDDAAAQPVVLINELIARHRFEGEDAIGGSIVVDGEAYTVIGVIENTHDRAMSRPPEPSLYFPAAQALVRTNAFVVRSGREAETLVPDLRRAVAELDVDQPLYEVQPISALIDQDMGPYLLIAGMMFSFALVSLLLGAVGIYGVTAYAVGRRTQEIGLRMAIGAERRGVMTMIVGEGMRRALLGVAIGLVLAYPLSRALRAIAVGVNPSDPLTFIMVAATLLLVAFLGTWLPAMRVARLDPVRALSAE